VDAGRRGQPTAVMTEWARIKRVNPAAKLVCLDIQPHATTQAPTRDDVLNIGGFSDAVYGVITAFAANSDGADGWVKAIEAIEL
jgi:60 kDa SS-A/Ro ribonucleoprotein